MNLVVQHSRLDAGFTALSDPVRRGILERLARGTATITELAERFDMTLTGVKKHVALLETAGMVVTEKHGRTRHCRLGAYRLDHELTWMQGHRAAIEGRMDSLERFLAAGGDLAPPTTPPTTHPTGATDGSGARTENES